MKDIILYSVILVLIHPLFSSISEGNEQDGYYHMLSWPVDPILRSPFDVAVDNSGNVYVADTDNSRIQKFSSDGVLLDMWGTYTVFRDVDKLKDGQFYFPYGIAVDELGRVYIADTGNIRIQIFDSGGNFLSKFWVESVQIGIYEFYGYKVEYTEKFYGYPGDVIADEDGYIYVTDWENDLVLKYSSGGALCGQWGNLGSGEGEFNNPQGIAMDSYGNIYVADMDNHRIQKLTSDGEFLGTWGTEGEGDGSFNHPRSIAVDDADYVYVADADNHRIQKFTSDGIFVAKWGMKGDEDGQFNTPRGVAVDNLGYVYVTDSENNRIQKFTSDGIFVTKWGIGKLGDEMLSFPMDVAVDGSDSVYVADSENNRIQKFTSDGIFVTKWGMEGDGDGQFHEPYGIAADNAGNVYVADTYNNRIQRFTSDGVFVAKWGTKGDGDGQFYEPWGLAVDKSGYVYVADTGNYRIQKFKPDGSFVAKWGRPGGRPGYFAGPTDVDVDADGYIYVADIGLYTAGQRIQKFAPNGGFVMQWGSYGGDEGFFRWPQGIAVDSMGAIYVADTENNRIQKFRTRNSLGVDFVTEWGTEGYGDAQFCLPRGIAVDSMGNIYVADSCNHRVQKFAGYPIPVAAFSADPKSGEFPLTVKFTDQSMNAKHWSWDFGDGEIHESEISENLVHEFTIPGNYRVTLTVRDDSSSDEMVLYICVMAIEPHIKIIAPEVDGKIRNHDTVQVAGRANPNRTVIEQGIIDENDELLDVDLAELKYVADTGEITGSFNIGALSAKTIRLRITMEDENGLRTTIRSNILIVDNDPPAKAVLIVEQGEIVNSASISLMVSADDARQMYIDGDIEGQKEWIPYKQGTMEVSLTKNDGVKIVDAKFRDDMGNESELISKRVILDTKPPTGAIVINNGDENAKSFVVELTLSATDENGVDDYQLTNSQDTSKSNMWSDIIELTAEEAEALKSGSLEVSGWDLRKYGGSSNEGTRKVHVKYRDKAGNWSDAFSDDIQVAPPPQIVLQHVEDNQEAKQSVTVVATIKSNMTITEATLHYRKKGTKDYTEASMKRQPDSFYYIAEIPGADVTLDGVEYYVSASDGLWTTTYPSEGSGDFPAHFTVKDTIAPVIEHKTVNKAPIKHDFTIEAEVTDSVAVKSVILFYKMSSDKVFTHDAMVLTTSPDIYSATITGIREPASVDYYIEASDSSSNFITEPPKGEQNPHSISFVDDESPSISPKPLPKVVEAGEQVIVEATVTDNLRVDKALLNYTITDAAGMTESGVLEMEKSGSGYSANLSGEIVMPGEIKFSISASDGSSDSEDSTVYLSPITVVDTTPPKIEISSVPSEIDVHEDIGIQARVTDNVEVKAVRLHYTDVENAEFQVEMSSDGSTYSAVIPAQKRTGTVKFHIEAEDWKLQATKKPEKPLEIIVSDHAKPQIKHFPITAIKEAGHEVTIDAAVSDNVGVDSVLLHYRTDGKDVFEPISMLESGIDVGSGAMIYSGDIPGSSVLPKRVEYYIEAVDKSSNVTTYPVINPDKFPDSFAVEDTVPPETACESNRKILIDDPIVIEAKAVDFTGIKEVKIFYREEWQGSFDSQIARNMGSDMYSVTLPPASKEGNILYYTRAQDNYGNESTGSVCSIFVEDPLPLRPTDLGAASIAGGIIRLTWILSTSPDVMKYNIYMDNRTGVMDFSKACGSVNGSIDHWESPELDEGTYEFVVRAVDRSNEEKNEDFIRAISDRTPPDSPTGLVAVSLPGGRIELTWKQSSSSDASAYNIYWNNALNSVDYSEPLVSELLTNAWTSGVLSDGLTYQFIVRCVDKVGNEEKNAYAVNAKADASPPEEVTGLSSSTHTVGACSARTSVIVEWSPALDSGTGLEGYSVVWDHSKTTLPDKEADIGSDVTTKTYQISGTQYFHIRPVDKAGNWSGTASHLGPFCTLSLSPMLGRQTGDVSVDYTLSDGAVEQLSVDCRYSIDNGSSWRLGKSDAETPEASNGEYRGQLTWHSREDIPFTSGMDVKLSITFGYDNLGVEEKAETDVFHLMNLVGDYDDDGDVDSDDMDIFIVAWDKKDITKDIGPAMGEPPDLKPLPDGKLDFEDLAVFVLMLNWSKEHNLIAAPPVVQSENIPAPFVFTVSADTECSRKHIAAIDLSEPVDVLVVCMRLIFDPKEVRVLKASEAGGGTVFLHRIDNDSGILEIQMARLGANPASGDRLAFLQLERLTDDDVNIQLDFDLRDGLNRVIAKGQKILQLTAPLPEETVLMQNYPNPFNPETWIPYQLAESGCIAIEIYSADGKLVRTLGLGEKSAGRYLDKSKAAYWDGRNDCGEQVASGIYFYRLRSGFLGRVRKLVILR